MFAEEKDPLALCSCGLSFPVVTWFTQYSCSLGFPSFPGVQVLNCRSHSRPRQGSAYFKHFTLFLQLIELCMSSQQRDFSNTRTYELRCDTKCKIFKVLRCFHSTWFVTLPCFSCNFVTFIMQQLGAVRHHQDTRSCVRALWAQEKQNMNRVICKGETFPAWNTVTSSVRSC